jgi:integrase
MQWAMAHGHAEKDPVAAAVHLLPRQRAKVEHFAAMPYRDVPAFLRRLRELAPSAGTLALAFAILTATRSGEVRGATWTEVDLRKRVWAIPAARMKADREHRVPLSGAALDVLTRCADAFGPGGFLFPSPSKKGLSDMTLTACLRRMRVDETTHGFRSFRDWAPSKESAAR